MDSVTPGHFNFNVLDIGTNILPNRIIFLLQKKTAKYLAALKKTIDNCDSTMYQMGLVYNMKPIGSNDPEEFAKYKSYFEEMKDDAQLKDYAVAALDAIAGRRFKII